MKENDKKRGAIAAIAAGGKLLAGQGGAAAHLMTAQMQEYIESFRQMRMGLYAEDRFNVLRSLDVVEWKRFALRWNIIPTFPHGFGSDDMLRRIMHTTRLAIAFDPAAKDRGGFNADELNASGEWLTDRAYDLPIGLFYVNGKVVGEVKQPSKDE